MSKAKAAKAAFGPAGPISVPAAIDPTKGLVTVNVYDGTRQPISPGTQVLVTIRDGAQNQLFRKDVDGPGQTFSLLFHDNFVDNLAIIAFMDGHEQAGYFPVTLNPMAAQTLDLMLLPSKGIFQFKQAQWTDLQAKKPMVAQIFAASLSGNPETAYGKLVTDHPGNLACLLNITTSLEQIFLPNGGPLNYFKEFDLDALAPDRFFGWADAALVEQLKTAAQQGEFQAQSTADLSLHGDATSSFKQKQFGEGNVQLTFHGTHHKTIDNVDCVYVEPDIDYFADPLAHLVLEVLPNKLSGHVTDPRIVYVLRWIAGQHSGTPNFDPLYTIE